MQKGLNIPKEITDRLGALMIIALSAPMLMAILIYVAAGLGEWPIFAQVRAGRNGKPFLILKIKTQKKGGKQSNCKFIRYIQHTHVDELLQLFNVLWGHMSLVGPRPHIPEQVALYEPWQRLRMAVKPGITGLRQINAPFNKLHFNQKIEDDISYIAKWSLMLDFKIIYRTIALFVGKLTTGRRYG